jgi:hypothetical protein
MDRTLSQDTMKSLLAYKNLKALKFFILPVLLAVFPALFFYGNNVAKLLLPSLGRAVLLYFVVAVLILIMSGLLFKDQAVKTANASFVFLIFFQGYGVTYDFLIEKDWVRVEHYTLLPFLILCAIYASWMIGKASGATFWNAATVVMFVLVVFSLVKIIPGELVKQQISKEQRVLALENWPTSSTHEDRNYPDIYFLIFDEFAGFESMRNYWNYDGVEEFIAFAQSKGFFVAEKSRSSSTVTLHLMAERLNYKEFPVDIENVNMYYTDINNNRAVRFLKSQGYTTVTFDETSYWYETYTPMPADHAYLYDGLDTRTGLDVFFDDFGLLVAENTMLKPFEKLYRPISVESTFFDRHRNFIFFTAEKVGQLSEIPSPKFVHVHLMIPHNPFMFDADGKPVDPRFYQDWNYYLDQYKFTIDIIETMIANILQDADPARPPIIIIQSDHGARNIVAQGGVALENYPEEYKTDILNMMLLPGFDTSQLRQDMNPINTFPLIFNHYFGTTIPIVE